MYKIIYLYFCYDHKKNAIRGEASYMYSGKRILKKILIRNTKNNENYVS